MSAVDNSPSADTITPTLWTGHQAPNLTEVHHTFRRFDGFCEEAL